MITIAIVNVALCLLVLLGYGNPYKQIPVCRWSDPMTWSCVQRHNVFVDIDSLGR